MFLTYTRTNAIPLAEFGNLTAGHPPFVGQSVTRPVAARFVRQVQRRYQQFPQQPVPMGPGLTAGNPPFYGQSVTRPPRAGAAFVRQVARRFRQTSPEWAMLDETRPTIPAALLTPTSVPPRLTGKQARSFRRPNLPPDYIATVGPGLSARPPFVGTAAGPRFTQRDFLIRARRYRQPDPRAALSGLTARTIGSFNGAKLGFLNVQATRTSTNFQITPHRTGIVTVQ
jgi:hypothetical protein